MIRSIFTVLFLLLGWGCTKDENPISVADPSFLWVCCQVSCR